MVRQTKVRRSVVTQFVKKSKLSSRFGKKNIFERLEKLLPKKYVSYFYKLAEQCFTLFTKICCNLSFIPISIDSQMTLTVKKSNKGCVAHYSILIVQILRILYMFVVTMPVIFEGNLDLPAILCITSLISYVYCFLVSSSLLFRPHETAQLINTTPLLLAFYPKDGEVLTMFQNAKNAIFVITTAVISVSCPLILSLFGFIDDDLPVSLYHLFESITGRPQFIPHLLWKLLVWPMEFLMFLQIVLLACCACMVLLTLPNLVLTCTNEIRTMSVNSSESWVELRRKYYLVQVFATLANSWIKFMIVPTIFGLSSVIIIFIYITLRHTDIPILIYIGVACMGFSLLFLLFWFAFETITLIRSTEAIVATLNTKDQPYFFELLPIERSYLTKYGKATRQLVFDIGDFTDYSIAVPITIWDEILNQLLFILTL